MDAGGGVQYIGQCSEVYGIRWADSSFRGETGDILVRGEEIPEGCFHAVAKVFVVHEDGSVLLMRRHLEKPAYPGCWECGAGGAVLKGEHFSLAARRELLEETETNLSDIIGKLLFCGISVCDQCGKRGSKTSKRRNHRLQMGG